MRDLDVSVHFNAYEQVEKPRGTEVLYVTESALAGQVSAAIASCGFINRGGKKRADLFFINNTETPAVLIEVCFVDSEADCGLYAGQFDAICESIADVLVGEEDGATTPPPDAALYFTGKVSCFGGPDDMGVSSSEGLAFIQEIDQAPHLFLPYQPERTSGLARRLNPHIHYIACRWGYGDTPEADAARRAGARSRAEHRHCADRIPR